MRLFLTTEWTLGLPRRWFELHIGRFHFGYLGCFGEAESSCALKPRFNLELSVSWDMTAL